jgi:hypothetical protein
MPHLQRNIAPPGASRPIEPSTWLALAGLWAFTHPWSGVHHDGILYAAQAMLHHLPEVFRGDLFFAYGSQDDYTVFGRAYGVAVDAFGLTGASRLGWAAAQLLWFGVAVAWISRVVPAGVLVPAAAVVFALPAFYSSDLVLRVAEPFLTARSFAEPLAAGGLLACLAGARAAGAALLLAAAVIHPIMAAPAVLAAALITFEPFWRRHWKPLLALGIAALAAVCWPFQGSWIARVDEPWYGLLRRCSPIVTPDEWRPLDWVRMLAPLVVLHQCARLAEGRWALAWRVIAACGALGLALTILAALSRWELGLQVQFWRFGWIAAWLAPVAAIGTAAALPGERIVARVALLAAVPAIVLTSHPWLDLLWMIPALYLVCLVLLLSDEAGRSPRARGLAFAVFSLMFVAVVAAAVLVQMALTSGGDPDLARAGPAFRARPGASRVGRAVRAGLGGADRRPSNRCRRATAGLRVDRGDRPRAAGGPGIRWPRPGATLGGPDAGDGPARLVEGDRQEPDGLVAGACSARLAGAESQGVCLTDPAAWRGLQPRIGDAGQPSDGGACRCRRQ